MKEREYNYAHLVRPLGHEERSYWYEVAYGKPVCSRKLLERDFPADRSSGGLDEWHKFYNAFLFAGIDFQSAMRYTSRPGYPNGKFSTGIIIRQPYGDERSEYLSRMWKRVTLHDQSVVFDWDTVKRYLDYDHISLENNLGAESYAMMKLAVNHVSGDQLGDDELIQLKECTVKYCFSSARSKNYHRGQDKPEAFENAGVVVVREHKPSGTS